MQIGKLLELVAGAERALAREDHGLRAGVQHVGRGADVRAARHDSRRRQTCDVCPSTFFVRLLIVADFLLLQVDREW